MNSSEISAILNSHIGIRKEFNGVYPADMLPVNILKPGFYVINTDPHYKGGQHWTALYVAKDKQKPMEYWDSYGFKPPKVFEYFLTTPYLRNTKFLQHPLSSTCGQYCIFFVLQKYLGRSLQNIVSLFSENQLENDIYVNDYIENNFCVDLDIFDIDFVHKQICHSLY